MADRNTQLGAISVGRRRRRSSTENFEQSNAPEAVKESEHNSVHDKSDTKRPRFESSGDNVDGSAPHNGQPEEEKKEDLDVQSLLEKERESESPEPESDEIAKADAGDWPNFDDIPVFKPEVFTPERFRRAQVQSSFCSEKLSLVKCGLRKADPSQSNNVCQVDCNHYLVINEKGVYCISEDRQEIPPEYTIEPFERELHGIRKYRVQRRGENTCDIVMIGCLNIYNYITWIAGETIMYEEPDYTDRTRVMLPPLALTFPADTTVDKYKEEHREAYEVMLEFRLRCAMWDGGYVPDEYGFDRKLW